MVTEVLLLSGRPSLEALSLRTQRPCCNMSTYHLAAILTTHVRIWRDWRSWLELVTHTEKHAQISVVHNKKRPALGKLLA